MLSGGRRPPGSLTPVWRHVRAIGVLPGVGVIAIPALVLALTDFEIGWGLDGALQVLPTILGVALIGAGLALMYRTIALFTREGDGTLAPWDPTQKLVVRGLGRNVPHPQRGVVPARRGAGVGGALRGRLRDVSPQRAAVVSPPHAVDA